MTHHYDTTGASGSHGFGNGPAKASVPLPTETAVRRYAAALAGSQQRLGYLLTTRGLRRSQIRLHGLGWDGYAYTIPVRGAGGGLVQLVRHYPDRAENRYVVVTGQGSHLYPALPHGKAVILCAGMFDALVGLQNDLPCVTTTCGARLPDHLVSGFAGKRVAICYDAGEDELSPALETEYSLMCVGALAWLVQLPLPEGGDVNEWFLAGRTADELLELIVEARP